MSRRFVVGLTGGIGSGKSAAATRFAELGAQVVDADVISHQLTQTGGAAMPQIRQIFGEAMLTPEGALNRAAMRDKIFTDPAARKQLEAILHPLIREQAWRECQRPLGPYAVLVVPLLVEGGLWVNKLDRIAVVDCDEAQQIARVEERSQLARPQIRAILATQASRDERLSAADDVLDNRGDLAALHQAVDALHQKYLALAKLA